MRIKIFTCAFVVGCCATPYFNPAFGQAPIPGWTPDWEWPPLPPQMEFAEASNPAEARLQDLAMMRPHLYLNRSYSFSSRSKAEAMLLALEGSVADITDVEFQIALHRIAALGNNPHSSIREGGFARNFGSIPVRGYFFDDGYHILRTGPGDADLLGARLVNIEGRAVDVVLQGLRDLVGGPDVYFYTVQADLLWTVPAILHALGLSESDDSLVLTLDLPDGRRVDRKIDIVGPEEEAQLEKGWVNLIPSAMPDDTSWTSLLSTDRTPLYLSDWESGFSLHWIDEGRLPYLRIRSLRDTDDLALGDFLSGVSEELAAKKPAAVIIDMRLAYGGDYTKTSGFYSSLPGALSSDGKIYLLLGNATYSAGILRAASLKLAAGDSVTTAGAGVGDRERFWSQAINYRLPHSRLRVYYALQMHDVADGCDNESICFPDEAFAERGVGPLIPDYKVPLLFADYAAGHDAVLDRVLELASATDRK